MQARVPVTFAPANVTVWVPMGTTVVAAARAAGVLIAAPCGGRGVCGSCGVTVTQGTLEPPDDQERQGLASAPHGVRLACRARVRGPVTVRPIVHQPARSAGSGATAEDRLVAGVDLGTTTVSAVLVHVDSGREIGRASVPDAQAPWGADVLTRVSAAMDGAAEELAVAAERSVVQALEAACGVAGTCLQRLDRVAIAGNTVMQALLARESPASLSTAPFTIPVGIDRPRMIRLPGLREDVRASLVAPIASFVGGDVSADLLAAGMVGSGRTEILIDIGTNAEVVVCGPLGPSVASAPAGPAFEGFGIANGGPWAPGAVEDVRFMGDGLEVVVAGAIEPRWVCGSGLVSAIDALLRAGHLDHTGLMTETGPLASRFSRVHEVLSLSLAPEGVGAPYLTQTDVRSFQTAKAAVTAALEITVRASGVKSSAVSRIVVAGGFGAAVVPSYLADLGVIPSDMLDKAEIRGDLALHGAAMLAFEPDLEDDLREFVRGAKHVDLVGDPGFSDAFVEHLALRPYSFE